MPVQPKVVLFDYGNVLCQPQGRAEVEAMAAILGVPVARFEEPYWKDRLAFDQATMSPRIYWGRIEDALSRSLSDSDRERLAEFDNQSWAYPDPIMVGWAARLRDAGVRTALLSNMPLPVRTHLRSCAWMPEFEYSCYSCDLGQVKPGPEIYRHCLQVLGAAPGDVLFLDDRQENIDAARRLGIHAIHFSTPEQAQCEIDLQYHLPVPILLKTDGEERASRFQSSF